MKRDGFPAHWLRSRCADCVPTLCRSATRLACVTARHAGSSRLSTGALLMLVMAMGCAVRSAGVPSRIEPQVPQVNGATHTPHMLSGRSTPAGTEVSGVAPAELGHVPAPSTGLVVEDLDRVQHDLDRILEGGESVVLCFYQTWCRPCIQEAPLLARAARQHAGRLRFFGVVSGPESYVDPAKVRDFSARHGLPYPQVWDRDLTLTRRFGVQGTPTIVVLSRPRGDVVFRGPHPPTDWMRLP